ncbi:MAG TPA: YjgN family protein [Burkholderiales bacterium]
MEPALSEQRYPVEFTGTTAQYFRIWIVNLALTVLTLGIYSAWAKVRKRRYFYAHTHIDGESFEYRGRPIAILKGRLIAVGLFLAFIVGGNVFPELSLETNTGKALFFILAVTVGPWLIVRSLKFNAANTAYRNVRLAFLGSWKGCFLVVIKYVWLALIAILYPYFKHQLVKYAAQHHAYGTTRFEVADFKKPFIHAYAVAFGLGLLGVVALIVLVVVAGTIGRAQPSALVLLGTYAGFLGTYAVFLLLYAFVRARTTNAVWNAIRIGPVRFECSMRGRDYMWIYLSNVAAIILTLGFATPWAVIRTMRYRARKFVVLAAGPLESFIEGEAAQVGAAGQEIAELFDLDVAL